MVFNSIKKICPELYSLITDKQVLELIVDGPEDIYFNRSGQIENYNETIPQNIIDSIAKEFIKLNPMNASTSSGNVHFSINDIRINICTPAISQRGYIFNLLRAPNHRITMQNLVEWGALRNEGQEIIEKLIKEGKNILIGGGVGAGVNTLCNVLHDLIDPSWRVVTIERSAMLHSDRKREARLVTPNNLGHELVNLVDCASRMRADYIIMPEIVGGEAFNFIELIRDGSSGIGVVKGNNIFDTLRRLELKVAQSEFAISPDEVRYMINEAFDYVIYQARKEDGSRKITGIGQIGLNENSFDIDLIYKE